MQTIFADSVHEAVLATGMTLDHAPEPGRMVRFSADGRKGDKAAWLRVFPDGDGAAFGNWRDGTAYTWQRRREGPPPDAAELKRIRQRAEEARKEAEAEREDGYREAAQKARRTWDSADPAREHPYLARKGICAHVARIRSGWLVLPVLDNEGSIQSIQSVSPTGEKRFLPGGKVQGGRCWIGDPAGAEVAALVEGFATGASVHEATGWPVCVAYSAGSLRMVALDVRAAHPDAKLVICGDDDKATDGNPGRQKALDAAGQVGGVAAFPALGGDEGSDFNDVHQQAGLAAVRSQLFEALTPAAEPEATAPASFPAPALAAADVRDGTATTRPLTENGNAMRLLDMHSEHIRFVPEVSGWLVWRDGWSWSPDGADVRAAAAALPETIYREGIGHPVDAAQHFAKWARLSQSLRVVQATVQLLSDQRAIRVPMTTIDADQMLVGYDSARRVIDLRTGTHRQAVPADCITKSLGVSDVGDARKATRWLSFLDQVFEGDTELIGWIHRWCGYTLTGSTSEQILVFCFGLGANGKSVLGELLRWIVGDYARAIPVETLCESRRQAGGASPDLADLAGARLAMSSETEDGQALAESLIKSLTAGDAISARPLYGKPFTFQPQFKLLMLGNHRPIVRGTDHGIWRRIRLVPFNRTFSADERDPHLIDTLKAEGPHILAWMVQGCIEWQRRGLSDVPRVVAAETSSYQGEQDLIGQWLADETTRDPASETTSKELYASYRQWAIEAGLKVASSVALGRRMGERGFGKYRSNGVTKWQGLAIRPRHAGFGGGGAR